MKTKKRPKKQSLLSYKLPCTFYGEDITRILSIIDQNIVDIQLKNVHERKEILIHRMFTLESIQKKIRNKTYLMHPNDTVNFTFDLREVLTLKYALFEKIMTPGLRDVFAKIDKYIHPAIQLEL